MFRHRRVLACCVVSWGLAARLPAQEEFRRGDVNADALTNISDAVASLRFLFLGTASPICLDAADADDNGTLQVTDAIRSLGFLFLGGPPIEAPLVECGLDPTADSLSCESFPPCSDGGGPPSGETSRRTLSGNVRDPQGRGIPGVAIAVAGASSVLTDARGDFVLQDPPAGTAHVHIDGGTAQVPGSRFAALGVIVEIAVEGPTELRPAATLPDLNAPTSVAEDVIVDDAGATTEPIDLGNTDGDMALAAPAGTAIRLGSEPAQGSVELSITAVEPEKVPMPLSFPGQELDASSFVSIQPADGFFDAGGGRGLDVVLPNRRGFPRGTEVDIWSFDHHTGAWVNRSDTIPRRTGFVELGKDGSTLIRAPGVITAGGWHAPVIPVDPACATVVVGRVVDLHGSGIPDAHLGLTTGNLGRSGAGGAFAIPSVPAYVVAEPPGCTPLGFRIEVVTPLGFGAVTASREVAAGAVRPGGTTDVGDIVVMVGETGALAGRVTDNGAGLAGPIEIRGPTDADILSDASGACFVAGLLAGAYTASFQFPGAPAPTVVSFEIRAGRVTTINIQRVQGAGSSAVKVRVVLDHDDEVLTPFQRAGGACVVLVGTDPGSSGGLLGCTNVLGEAVFAGVDGPFTVTAQLDRAAASQGPGGGIEVRRFATTVAGIRPPRGVIGIPLFGDEDPVPTEIDAVLTGTVANLALLGKFALLTGSVEGLADRFFACLNVDAGGQYAVGIPSGLPLDILFLHAAPPTSCGFGMEPLHVLLATSVGPAAPGETIALDFDIATDAVPFDHPVALTYQNPPAAIGLSDFDLSFGSRDGPDVEVLLSSSTLPGMLLLPDPAHLGLQGLDLFLYVEVDVGAVPADLEEVRCGVKVRPGAQALTLPFPGRMVLNQPLSSPTLEQTRGMLIDFTEGAGGLPAGPNVVYLSTRFQEGGSDVHGEWNIILRRGTTSFRLSPTPLAMFGVRGSASGELEVEVEQIEITPPFDFDAFFSEDVEASLRAFNARDVICENGDGVLLEVLPDAGG